MNTIDLIVCLVLVMAVWNGWRQGFIVQVCSLAGIVAGIWLAARYGTTVGEWLRLDESVSAAGGFAVVLIAVIIAVAVAARVVRRLFRFAGFGLPDIVLGVAVSAVKFLLILSALFSAFDALNEGYAFVDARTIENSKTYRPVMRFSRIFQPLLKWAGERMPDNGPEAPEAAGQPAEIPVEAPAEETAESPAEESAVPAEEAADTPPQQTV